MKKGMSAKKKAFITILVFLVVGFVSVVAYYLFRPDPPPKVILTTAFKSDVTQTLEATGTVESANRKDYSVLNGTKVSTVNFRVGDRVKKGDVLATFDTSSLNALVDQKQKNYNAARDAFKNASNEAGASAADIPALEKQIADVEAKIKELEQKNAEAGKKETSKTTLDKLKSIFGDSLFLNILFGNSSAFDMSSLTGMSAEETKLASLQLELMQLNAKLTLARAQAGGTLENTLKVFSDSALEDLNNTKAAVAVLKSGWVAEADGIVRTVNIVPGQAFKSQSSLSPDVDLSSIVNLLTTNSEGADIVGMMQEYFKSNSVGMSIEYYPFAASFILGKYDVLKVKMDQVAKVKAANGEMHEGKITYISPVASSSSSINLTSILGSGGSSSGIEAKVSIPNPDAGIIIGLDVEISIDVDKAKDALLVPAEAVQFDSEGSYVFIYNAKSKRVSRAEVKTGIFSGTHYQILSGCSEGDVIVKAPPHALKNDDKVAIETTESPSMPVTEQTQAAPD